MDKLILSYLQNALFDLRVTIKGIKKTELAPMAIAKDIASEMDHITTILRYTNCRSLYITIGVLLGEPCQ